MRLANCPPMRHLLVILAALSALALTVPAGAQLAEPVLNEPCTNTDGRTVVTLDAPFSDVVETPVGAGNLTGPIPAGTGEYVIDLQGLEEGVRKTVNLTLSVDNPVADYDLVVNGENDLSTDNPENKSVPNARHCQVVSLETDVFIGVPIDTLTLDVAISTFAF